MERIYIKDLKDYVGKEVSIKGWVDVRRDQGKLIFFDFRDMTGYVQGVILPNAKEAHSVGEKLRSEWVVLVKGKISQRPEKSIQKDKQNGDIELEILAIEIDKITERERLVLALYYDEELNLREVGEILNVSESRISQIHSQAMIRLQSRMQEWKTVD